MQEDFQYTKTFRFFTADEIEDVLAQHAEWTFFWQETFIPPDMPNPYNKKDRVYSDLYPKDEFEDDLEQDHLRYYAYIKFFRSSGLLFGIVAGKTGTRLVNASKKKKRGDVCFSVKADLPQKWNAKEFLLLNSLRWAQDRILIVVPKHPKDDLKAHEQEVLEIESKLQTMFNLFGS